MVKVRQDKAPRTQEMLAKFIWQHVAGGPISSCSLRLPLLDSQSGFPSLLHLQDPDTSDSQEDFLAAPSSSRPESVEEGESSLSASETTLAQIMSAIKDCKATLTVDIETIHIDFSLLKYA